MLIDIEATGAAAPEMVRKSWQLIELHGLWWAYEDKLPPLEGFKLKPTAHPQKFDARLRVEQKSTSCPISQLSPCRE
jgi:hypothetical protein